ncbi:hypothetical protein EAI_02599 [Harpegnathos saltator]|uniref:Uncharacterized protein n=1 Tax=Harpegnathos saltator TaxID=610380 RepID=E2C815_HARSA|nr:hypothetical protein EAI_02599 [Harpegnathos saltator]
MPQLQVDIRDTKVFEIALDDMNYDEESENEMIKPADLAGLKPLAEDESKYAALHSHVRRYNQRNTEDKQQLSNIFSYLRPHAEETFNSEQEEKPFIAGFKHELDQLFYTAAMRTTAAYRTSVKTMAHEKRRSVRNYRSRKTKVNTGVNNVRIKREEAGNQYGTTSDEDMDFFQMAKNSNVTINAETIEYLGETQSTRAQYDVYEYGQESTSEDAEKYTPDQFLISSRGSTLADTENPEEEPYDYETLKLEYEQQLEYGMKHGKVLNYTEKKEPKDTPREALKRIMGMKQAKNCTKEEISQIGIKAIECLAYDYQHARDMATAGKILSRTWLVLRVWLLIYICLAIPCWCQRGNFIIQA